MKKFLSVVISSIVITSALSASESTKEVVLSSEVKWEKLNAARGDKSPQAATLWGDRKGSVATGFLAKFIDGFSSPPHIHNVTYRAVVISGTIHNDDPSAANMWMPAGSFWTQPEGEVHITSAKGTHNMALVEIDNGPYLVRPIEQAFDNGQRPINIDASNLVWTDILNNTASKNSPKIAYLWGSMEENQFNSTFVKLPAGFKGNIHSYGSIFRGVVIQGKPQYVGTSIKDLESGSYFGSKGEAVHQLRSSMESVSIIYIRTNGKFEVTPIKE